MGSRPTSTSTRDNSSFKPTVTEEEIILYDFLKNVADFG